MTARATERLHLRVPPAEKQQLRDEARRHGISMSALVRINNMTAKGQREREQVLQSMYPQPDRAHNQ